MASPRLSVVISTLGSHETLKRVLDGYSRQSVAMDAFEVVLVVDAAEPDRGAVEQAIGRRDYTVTWIDGPEPGLSANRNAGRRAARSDLVLFTDNDTVPVPALVSEHVQWHARYPDAPTCILGHVRWAPEVDVTVFMRWLDSGIQFNYANIKGTDVEWSFFYGANASLKRSFIERVGDFDQERLPYGYEDVDWAYRASRLGLRVLYNRAAVVDHLRTMTLEFWTKRIRRVAAAEFQFTQLHPEMPPWFHRVFTDAASAPPARGRGIALAPYVPRRTPWLGKRVWHSVDTYYKQRLAPHFLDAWADVAEGRRQTGQLDVSEWSSDAPSAAPGGPK